MTNSRAKIEKLVSDAYRNSGGADGLGRLSESEIDSIEALLVAARVDELNAIPFNRAVEACKVKELTAYGVQFLGNYADHRIAELTSKEAA